MKTPSEQRAEELAMEVATEICSRMREHADMEDVEIILSHIPLAQYEACVEALREAHEDVAATARLSPIVGEPRLRKLVEALIIYDTFMKERNKR